MQNFDLPLFSIHPMIFFPDSRTRLHDALLALALLTPVFLMYASHYLAGTWHTGLVPSGFLQLDQPFYMASAREYQDHGTFSLFFANPSDPSPDSPAVYFSFPILILAILLGITNMDPGLLFALFGLLSGWGCFYICIRFWRSLSREMSFAFQPGLLLLCWGGGLLVLGGLALSVLKGHPGSQLFVADPSQGWWFLNWGRNVVLPLEAFYHLLFMGILSSVYFRKYRLSLLFLLMLALSHPFTGLQALLIYLLWIFYEQFIQHKREIPRLCLVLPMLMLAAHLLYYLLYLPSFPSHRQVFDQWKLNWNLKAHSALLAYLPVLIPALAVLFSDLRQRFQTVFLHFLIACVVGSLLLGFNNLFFSGYQPLHFTRGYLWLTLFLMGYPAFQTLAEKMQNRNRVARVALTALLLVLFLPDNAAWFIYSTSRESSDPNLQINPAQKHLLLYLETHGNTQDLLISDDTRLGIFSLVYTPVRAVYSHWANTPDALQKVAMLNAFRMEGRQDRLWKQQRLYVALDTRRKLTQPLSDTLKKNFKKVDSCETMILYYRKK